MIYVNENRNIDLQEWKEILSRLGISERLVKAKTVAVKPNFAAGTYADPNCHVMSDLNLLRNIVELVGQSNPAAKILIVESDSTGNGFAYEKFERLHLPDSLKLENTIASRVFCLDLTRDRLTQIQPKGLKYFSTVDKTLLLSETLMKSDFKISLSNLKTHSVAGYTGACKILFGCLPAFDKSMYHPHIHQVVHDVTAAIYPDLNIVDAFYGMERNGPVQGKDVDSGYRVFSDNPVEADDFAASSVGLNPNRIRYLKLLHKTFSNTKVHIAERQILYRKPQMFLRVMNALGLTIQNAGLSIANFGHRIHSCPTIVVLAITIVRPVLVRLIDINTLKRWKRKIMK